MSFSRYQNYKNSGVEWLGEVPAHWKVRAIKHIVSTPITDGPHETPNFPDEGIPFVSAEAVSSGHIDFNKIRGFISEKDHLRYSEKYHPQRGDIYMIKSGATTGITALVETDDDFNIWSPLAAIRCGSGSLPQFVLNFMRSKNFLEAVTLNWSFGTQQNIGMGVIENLAVTVPPLEEQSTIAAFLDRETSKIDALIAEQEKLFDLTKEHIRSLVFSSTSASDTTTLRFGHAATLSDRPVHKISGEIYTPLGLYNRGRGLFHKEPREMSEMGDSDFYWVEEGDLIISGQFAWEGAVALAGEYEAGCVVSHRYPVLRGVDGIALTEYLFAFLTTEHGNCLLSESSSGAAGRNRPLNVNVLFKEKIPVPNMEAQIKVAKAVHQRWRMMQTMEVQTKLLKERRTALISAAVTGKIDVRGLVVAQPEREVAA